MKEGPHQWPSGAATRKYVDRAKDQLTVRLDRQTEKIRGLQADLLLQKKHIDILRELIIDQQG